ncbi:Sporulation-specific cell division protein SsgB [Streptomyces sp. RB17]|uniref:SsgA family sporulation/cell division regulator n=1 Tax=Streptomyces sp. RB17 TaxID=2585197 RepID=UPI001305ADD2|nr:SsgA family sporulation/cell division regulator [Streptomyces sp. RB17]MQY39993.1 Sporulation-specific cell division protein SsgB [Streptomyces sp. RB17]
MRSSTDVISTELHALAVLPDESVVPVPTELRYHAGDPYAVRAMFCPDAGRKVEWFFARELLADGLHRPVGAGDVRLRPTRRRGQDMVRVALMSPAGQAELLLPRPALARFLRRTDAMVPPGTEGGHLALDDTQLWEFRAGH